MLSRVTWYSIPPGQVDNMSYVVNSSRTVLEFLLYGWVAGLGQFGVSKNGDEKFLEQFGAIRL